MAGIKSNGEMEPMDKHSQISEQSKRSIRQIIGLSNDGLVGLYVIIAILLMAAIIAGSVVMYHHISTKHEREMADKGYLKRYVRHNMAYTIVWVKEDSEDAKLSRD